MSVLLTGSTDRRFSNHSAGARIAKIFDAGICLRNTFFWLSEIRKIGRRLESDRFAGSRMYEGELCGVQTQA